MAIDESYAVIRHPSDIELASHLNWMIGISLHVYSITIPYLRKEIMYLFPLQAL